MEGSLFCKGRYIPSPEGIIPFMFRDLVKIFFYATKVKISKNYIVGCIFEFPLFKGKLPLMYR